MGSLLLLAIIIAVIALLLVLVAWVLRTARPTVRSTVQSQVAQAAAAVSAPVSAALPADAVAQIEGLLAGGDKVAAIKLMREHTDLGIAEAKHRIDAWNPGAPQVGPFPSTLPSTELSAEVHAEIERLLAEGKTIDAIKMLREQTGVGLKQAKDRIDAWVPGAPN